MRSTGFILLFLLFTLYNFAENRTLTKVDVTNLNVNSGLASNEVTCILQDKLGFMWFGTTNGLCRYDGYQFKIYRSDYLSPSLFVSNHILLMEEDHDGKIWIVTSKEVVIFNPMTGQTTPVPVEVSLQSKIKSLLITKKGDILFGTTNGVFKYDDAKSGLTLIKEAYVRALYEDSRGYIWVGTWGSGFFTLNLNTLEVETYDAICKDKSFNVTGFAEDDMHRMWVSTWDSHGMLRLEKPFENRSDQYRIYPSSKQKGTLPSAVIYKVSYDALDHSIWVGTAKGLAVLKDLESTDGFSVYDSDVLQGSEIWTTYNDGKNVIWVSALGGGVNKMVRRNVSFVHNPLPGTTSGNEIITALYEDEDSLVWIGVRLDILWLWDKKTGRQYSYRDSEVLKNISKESNAIQAILKHRRTGSIWLGTRYDGVYVVKCNGAKPTGLKRLRDEYPAIRNINALVQDSVGRVWIATEQGLFIGNSINEQKYMLQPVEKLNKAINDECVQAVLCDPHGIWIGTKNYGAFHLSVDGELTEYNMANGKLNYDNVLCFYEDSKKQLWIGTQGGGLSKFNKETRKFEMLETIRMFSDNAIYSIVEDERHNLWLASGKGLVCMSLIEKDNTKLYTQSEGLVNTQFMRASSLRLSDSEILFGGYNGVDCYIPGQHVTNTVAPKTAIVDVSIMNIPLKELMDRGDMEKGLLPPYAQSLTLAYNQNNVMLSFSSLSYTNQQANRYAYRLKGVDKDWIYVDANKRYISYNNLNTGVFVFEVKSCNENGVWSEPMSMEITVLPPPWLTWWAYVIYILAAGIFGYIAFQTIRRRIILQNALKIEQIEHRKSEEVNQAKLKFFTNISHELFTPLSVMQCSIDSLQQDAQSDKQTLNIMKLNLKRLQRLLQQIMEFRKAESGNLKLKVSNNNIVAFVKELCEENFYPLLESKNITLNFQTESPVIMAYFDVDKLDKILYNLLSNALKYNYQDGVISVSVLENCENERRNVIIKVENTGDGIPENKLPLLFKRFYEGDYRKFKTKGTGIGLSLTRDLVELHQGEIAVQSILQGTTVFAVTIPADKENYAQEQLDEEPEVRKEPEMKTEDSLTTDITDIAEEVLEEEPIHLLLVEDDTDLLEVMAKVLGKQFKVSTANNGKAALEILRANEQIEIVITDYVMPVMNGIELCREIRQDETLNYLPIMMLTAKTQSEYYLEGYDAGADVYIAKPVEMAVLMAQIKVLIANRKLLVDKYRQKEDLDVQELGLSMLDREFLDKAISTVEEHLENSEFSNEMFCQMMTMTQSTLYRRLKSLTGLSPNEFIRDVRIKKACMLLQSPGLQVSEIAYAVGFTDPKYFSLIFKKVKGMSPTKYQETLR